MKLDESRRNDSIVLDIATKLISYSRALCEGARPGKYYHHTYFCRTPLLCSGLMGHIPVKPERVNFLALYPDKEVDLFLFNNCTIYFYVFGYGSVGHSVMLYPYNLPLESL